MKIKKLSLLLGVMLLLSLVVNYSAYSQFKSHEIWIKVSDSDAAIDSTRMWFGNNDSATYRIDPSLTLYSVGHIKEAEMPPCPPGMCVKWSNIPGRVNSWGLGLNKYDFRGWPTNPTRKDTFKLTFQNGTNTAADFLFKWDIALLRSLCDSIYIVGPAGLVGKVDMFTQDSVIAPAAGDNAITFLTIYKYHKDTTTDVKPENPTVPDNFALHQSYPNPFNPSTTIRYDVKNASFVDVSVYNLLGQKVATLISENHMPGTGYTVTWNGLNDQGKAVSTGVYYARMTARSANGGQEFSALQKLLLVK